MWKRGLARAPDLRRCASRWLRVSASQQAAVEIESREQFQEKVMESSVPVLVDFHARWCAPCRTLAPRLEEVTSQKQLTLAKVDIDVLPDLALDYEVNVVPAVLGVRGGEIVGRFVGLRDSQFLDQFATEVAGPTSNSEQ